MLTSLTASLCSIRTDSPAWSPSAWTDTLCTFLTLWTKKKISFLHSRKKNNNFFFSSLVFCTTCVEIQKRADVYNSKVHRRLRWKAFKKNVEKKTRKLDGEFGRSSPSPVLLIDSDCLAIFFFVVVVVVLCLSTPPCDCIWDNKTMCGGEFHAKKIS